jgi:hypothetical protein
MERETERRETERDSEEVSLPPFSEAGYREGMDKEHGAISEPTPDEDEENE